MVGERLPLLQPVADFVGGSGAAMASTISSVTAADIAANRPSGMRPRSFADDFHRGLDIEWYSRVV